MFPRGWQCWAGGTQVGRLKVKGFNARKHPSGILVPAYFRAASVLGLLCTVLHSFELSNAVQKLQPEVVCGAPPDSIFT